MKLTFCLLTALAAFLWHESRALKAGGSLLGSLPSLRN